MGAVCRAGSCFCFNGSNSRARSPLLPAVRNQSRMHFTICAVWKSISTEGALPKASWIVVTVAAETQPVNGKSSG